MDEFSSHRLRLLVVENDRVTARDLEAILRRRGFDIVGVAYSPNQAIDIVQRDRPDLVILDIQLDSPEDGIELARRFGSQFNLPFIFVTGYSEEAILERARAVQPAAFLRKPFSDAEIAVCLDSVVERRLAGERLSLRLPGIEAVSQHLPQAVIATDLDGNVVYLNEAAVILTGCAREDALRRPLAQVAPLVEAGGPGSHPSGRSLLLKTSSGEEIPVVERSAPIRTSDGEAIGLVTMLATPETESLMPPVNEAPESKPVSVGFEAPVEPSVFPPSQPPSARSEALRKIANLSRDPAFKELIAKRKPAESASANPVPVEIPPSSEAVFTAAGMVGAAVLQVQAGAPMEEVGDPLLRIDEDGRIGYANSEAIRVFAHEAGLNDTFFRDHFELEDAERCEEQLMRTFAEGRRHRFEFHDSRRGLWFEVRVYPTRGGILVLFTDITTTRLEAAEQVRQQRLEGLGLLARGFAHDFNNALTSLTGNISLARERHLDDIELQSMLEAAQAAASKATGLVQQLMTFARGGRPIRERTRIPDLVRRILTEQRLRHPDIRYQYQGGDAEVIANVDPAQVGRLIENLLINSAAAMPNGGVLIVRSTRISPEAVLRVRSAHTPADEDHLLIEVIDTGHGMSEQDLERVFEPYFTTRRENNATGIGLTVCESIARAHGGFIQLQSKEGKGTIATFCAPLGRGGEEAADLDGLPAYPNFPLSHAAIPLAQLGEPLLVGTRILILEDDAPIRRLMAATLRRAGHEVVETKDGRETIAVYTAAMEKGERFHLLICDLTIENGMGGVETMRRLLQIDPDILAIVSSGYSDAPAMSSPASFGFKAVLPKPYAPTELRAAVHRILSAHHIIP